MSAIDDRRAALVTERTTLESILAQIQDNALTPKLMEAYVESQLGGEGSKYRGDNIVQQITDRLKEIDRQLGRLPYILTRRVASVVDALGADRSTYGTR